MDIILQLVIVMVANKVILTSKVMEGILIHHLVLVASMDIKTPFGVTMNIEVRLMVIKDIKAHSKPKKDIVVSKTKAIMVDN